jgi:chromosome segregation ATPase
VARSIEMMSRWAWLTICAILLGWALALGYLLVDTQERLSAAQSELAIAKEHESQAAAQIVQLRDAASALKSQLSELGNHANLTKAQIAELRSVITNLKSELAEAKKLQGKLHEATAQVVHLDEALKTANTQLEQKQRRVEALEDELEQAKTSEVWRLLSERTVALDGATAYRHALEKDLATAKAEIENLKLELGQAKAEAAN